jgi:predicted small secreted protein
MLRPISRKVLITLAASGIVLAAAACNTVKGLGRDIQSVGSAGEKATH